MTVYRIFVSGVVQGVNFRNMVKSYALQNGLKGSVRNLGDGRVEILVDTVVEEMDLLISWLKSSPGISVVKGVEVEELEQGGGFDGFEILR